MDALLTCLSTYLREVLNIQTLPKPWAGGKRLPVYFNTRYEIHQTRLLNVDCLLMTPRTADEVTPTEIDQHIRLLEGKACLPCIYIAQTITPYNRKRLIERGVQFVIPGNQMFLPRLGLDLREHFKLAKEKQARPLGPAARAAIIYCLLHGHNDPINATLLTQWLRYTRMTMTRTLDEFVAAGLGHAQEKGRERWFTFNVHGLELWQKALPLMRSPVKRRARAPRNLENGKLGMYAGLTALAHKTLLVEPKLEVRAITVADAQRQHVLGKPMIDDIGPDLIEFEVWAYDPELLTRGAGREVDPLSLYLSLQGNTDERVQAALEQLMSTHKW